MLSSMMSTRRRRPGQGTGEHTPVGHNFLQRERQAHDELRPLTQPRAVRGDRATVQLDHPFTSARPSQAALAAIEGGISLCEWLE